MISRLSRRRALPVVAFMLLPLAACGGTAPATPATPAPSTPAPATPAAVTPAPATPAPATPAPADTPAPTTPAPATPAAAPALEGRIEVADRGYAVTLPDGWLRVELDDEFMDQLAEELGSDAAADVRELFGDQLQALVAAGMSLFAFRTADLESGFATNVNILSLPSGGMTLDTLEQLNVAQLEQLPSVTSPVAAERVQLPAAEAINLNYTMQAADASGAPIEVEAHQYLLIDGATQHIVTVTGAAGDATLATDARAMAESFELLGD